MIIDIHAHAFPPVIRQSRERFFSDEAAFKLLYNSPKSKLAGATDIIAMMAAEGIDKTVIFGFPWRNADTFKRHNDYIMESVGRYPDQLIGFCCFDPLHPHAAQEAERCLTAGLSGVGELAFYTSGIKTECLDGLEAIMSLCRKFDCPVMIHTNEPVGHEYPGKSPNTLAQIYTMIKRFDQNRIILAHWGGGIFLYALLKKDVREAIAHVWFDTAASPFLYRPQIYQQAIELAGEAKILLGTDFPLLKPRSYFKEMTLAGLSKSQRDAVSGKNAASLLKLM